ncbi:TPA: restriction endonuclease subunit S, partial [Streptococcus suis]
MSEVVNLGSIFNRFSSGKTIKSSDIFEVGEYPVFGGNGIRGFCDFYNFEGECLIIGRQGANCGNVRYFSGKAYMTEHAIIGVANEYQNVGYIANKLSLMKLEQFQGQSAQPGLSVQTLSEIPIQVPEKSVQDKVFSLLSILDQKIALNNQINEELEAMAKTLYDYWFVQFDFPDENGKPYKSSGGKMVYNDQLKREIPEGWGVENLSNFLTIKNGKDHKDLSDGDYPVYGSGGLMRKVEDYIFEGESVLIPRKGTLNNIMYVDEKFWTVDTMFYTHMKIDYATLYTYFSIKDIDFTKLNTGTGVPSMTASILYQLQILNPNADILKNFDELVRTTYRMIFDNHKQNQELNQLRDWLLPM